MTATVPMLDLAREAELLWPELQPAVEGVLRSGQYIGGPEVSALEREVGEYLGGRTCVAVNSGTDALVVLLRALGVGPGHEVITTPFTFVATGSAILHAGATPVFCDIEPDDFNLDPATVEAKVGARTRALLVVHLFGQPARMPELSAIAERHGLFLVEDAAQALGARVEGERVATLGSGAALSFFPSKNLGAFGDAGMIVVPDPDLADRARMLASHGSRRKYHNEILGYNSRLDAVQAAILRVKLRHLDEWNRTRRRIAKRYDAMLAQVPEIRLPKVRDRTKPVFHQYTIRVPPGRRDALRSELERRGVASMVYYPVPLHRLPLFERWSHPLERAERAAAEVVSLPIGPTLDPHVQDRIAEAVVDAFNRG